MLERRKRKLVEVVDKDSKKFNEWYKHKELNRLAKVERKRLKKHKKKFAKA